MAAGSEYLLAGDGHLARVSGEWAFDKLYYVERYMHIFSQSTEKKWRRICLDLLAGPGRCVFGADGFAFDGSPVLAAKTVPPFTAVVAIESEPALASALRARLSACPTARVIEGNCNDTSVITQLRVEADRLDTLTLAFLDMLGTDVDFGTVRTLTAGCRIDLLITLQISDLVRNAELALTSRQRERFDAFFGTPEWADVVQQHASGDRQGMDLATALTELYVAQLSTLGYLYVQPLQRLMKNTTQAPLYRLLLASKHPLGKA
jgi:three-Cys-motif partner protein